MKSWIAPLIYIAVIVAANLTVAAFGPGVTLINAFLLIGLDISLRDKLHTRWQGQHLFKRMLALIAVSAAISYMLNPVAGQIAIASVAAFFVSNVIDTLVFQWLHRRGNSFIVCSNGSNVASAMTDSLLFPWIAFNVFMPGISAGQFAFKFFGGAIWALVLTRRWSRAA